MRDAIQELRNAELKRAESRAKQEVLVEMQGRDGRPLSPGTLAEGVGMEPRSLTENQFSILVSTDWRFIGGDLDDEPALPALVRYWNDVDQILVHAEQLLGRLIARHAESSASGY